MQSNENGMMITASDLVKVYKNKVKAVDKISFEVRDGEIFGFLGPNGAGKTTTIKMLTTLATVTAGKATVAGYDVRSHPAEVRNSIGVVPQELTADEELKGIENLILSARLHHVSGEVAHERARDLLKLVDLEAAADRRVKTYSGGMRRRLQLAMGLLHTPKVLFLDEPTLGLDVQTRSKMWEYIQKLNRDDGLTVFMTTHYLEEADSLCNRIAIIDEGVIKVSGTPAELKERLGGDILTIEIADGGPDLSSYFKSIEEVSTVTKKDSTYRITLPKTEKALPAIVAGLTEKEMRISSISFTKPTLDQVFLEVTGRSMRDEESPAASPAWVQAVK
jgi:ABC-2 type transport system ATP-binding protein